jgi:peptidoglycan hydrolase-like protein with peptidoglycan-binding domain
MSFRRLAALCALVAALGLVETAAAVTNPQIAGLQVALRARGLYAGPVDAIAGPMTVRAVRVFQRRQGLAVDGIAGPQTRRALGRLGRPLFGRRMIRRGHVGWDVSVLQFLLGRRGFRPGGIDGHFGVGTERAVRRYQRGSRLVVDGMAGMATMGSLYPSRGGGRAVTKASIRRTINFWARWYGVSPRLARALAWMESGYQPNVTSPAGAWGVMQVTPATWRFVETVLLGTSVPRTAYGNVRVGVAYLHHLLHAFGSERLAVAAYHQGPHALRRRGMFTETRRFVAAVLALKRRV